MLGRNLSKSLPLLAVLCAVAGLLVIAQQSYGKDKEKLTPEEKIEKTLKQPTSFEFVETPLQEVAIYLGKMHGINILLDRRALSDECPDPKTPITFSLKHPVQFRSALNLMLHDLDLEYVIEDEVIIIVSGCAAQERLDTKIYEISEFVGNRVDKLKTFAKVIETCVAPESWIEVGGEGSIIHLTIRDKSVLVILQTREAHRDIEMFLNKLRAAVK